MHKLFAIGINLAIIAFLAGSLLSGKPLWMNTQAAVANPAALTLDTHEIPTN